MKKTRVGILGFNGRMGNSIRAIVEKNHASRIELFRVDLAQASADEIARASVIIDFSSPEAAVQLCEKMKSLPQASPRPPFVVGSTGWTPEQTRALDEYSKRAALLQASNFSLGVYLTREAIRLIAPKLNQLGYQASVSETHHVHKKDRPSGTALTLIETLKLSGFSSVPCQAERTGEVIGTHEIRFQGPMDQITIEHHATDRSVFAQGALDVSLWISGLAKRVGRLTLDDYFRDLAKMG